MISWRKPAPAADAPGQSLHLLSVFDAFLLLDVGGWWVYVLCDIRDGHVFYVGQSASLLRRLADHRALYKEQWDPARIYLIRCADQAQADLREQLLIEFYEPEHGDAGRVAQLRERVHVNGTNMRFGHKNSPHRKTTLDSNQDIA